MLAKQNFSLERFSIFFKDSQPSNKMIDYLNSMEFYNKLEESNMLDCDFVIAYENDDIVIVSINDRLTGKNMRESTFSKIKAELF